MSEFFGKIMSFVESTKLIDQIAEVDYVGLSTNPWFLVPFIALVLYLIWKQRWRDMIFIAIFIGVWWASGTDYMKTLVVGEELQVNKVLPVLFGGAAILGIVIYLLFGRSIDAVAGSSGSISFMVTATRLYNHLPLFRR